MGGVAAVIANRQRDGYGGRPPTLNCKFRETAGGNRSEWKLFTIQAAT